MGMDTETIDALQSQQDRLQDIRARQAQLEMDARDARARLLAGEPGASDARRAIAAELAALREDEQDLAAEVARGEAAQAEAARQATIATWQAAADAAHAALDVGQGTTWAAFKAFEDASRRLFDLAADYAMAAARAAHAQGVQPNVLDTQPHRLLGEIYGKLAPHFVQTIRHEVRYRRQQQQGTEE